MWVSERHESKYCTLFRQQFVPASLSDIWKHLSNVCKLAVSPLWYQKLQKTYQTDSLCEKVHVMSYTNETPMAYLTSNHIVYCCEKVAYHINLPAMFIIKWPFYYRHSYTRRHGTFYLWLEVASLCGNTSFHFHYTKVCSLQRAYCMFVDHRTTFSLMFSNINWKIFSP